MSNQHKYIIAAAALLLAFAAGRFLTPTKVQTVEQIREVEVEVIKEVIKEVEAKTSTTQKNTQTKTVITEYPDGKKVTEIYELNQDTIVIEVEKKVEIAKESESVKQTEEYKMTTKTFSTKDWSVGAMAGVSGFDINSKPFYGVQVDRRILGPVHVGGFVTDSKKVGLTVRVSF